MTRFTQIDRIQELVPGRRLVAVKNLTLAESYLHDHFPRFPVMPGVMMLESMYQAAAWLVRISEQFAHSMVVLQEAKNVKFADFVQPGDQLVVTCEWVSETPQTVVMKCEGTVGSRAAVKARLTLERYNLVDRDPAEAPVDRHMILEFQRQFALLYPQGAAADHAAGPV
ncbi:MAG: 3-hydroxyacyl-ACP dehydratase FabZ family protein [Pirellulales bacterium]